MGGHPDHPNLGGVVDWKWLTHSHIRWVSKFWEKNFFSSAAFLSRKKFLPLVGGWGVYNILLCIKIFVYLCS